MYLGPVNPDNPGSVTVDEILKAGTLESSFDKSRVYKFFHNIEQTDKYVVVFLDNEEPCIDFTSWEDAVAFAVRYESEGLV